jgi:hypothetical protein
MSNPKMIPDPNDETKQIANPDYNPELNEDGTPIEKTPEVKPETPAEIEARLRADFKAKMDALDAKRKDAETRVAEFERKEREAETQRLKDEGKLEEAHKRELEDREARLNAAERRITELTRDIEVKTALSAYEFRNARAAELASKEITGQLIKNDDGNWVHKDGETSVADFAKSFLEHDDNSFLLKTKQSSGIGATGVKPADTTKKSGSVFDMDTADVMRLAAEGKLPHQQKR